MLTISWINEMLAYTQASFGPCSRCQSRGLCAVDCTLAPWNMDAGSLPPSPFLGLLRQRRWAGSPVPTEDIFWIDHWQTFRFRAGRLALLDHGTIPTFPGNKP